MRKKVLSIIFIVFMVLMTLNNIYMLINIKGLYSIENTLRLVASIILILITLLIVFLDIKVLLKNKRKNYIIGIIVNIILIAIIGFVNINFNLIYGKLHKVSTNYTTYALSLVTLKDSTATSLKDVGSKDIAVINDHEIANGYNMAEQTLKDKNMNNKLVEYESYFKIIDDLLAEKITYAFLPSNYGDAFSAAEGYEELYNKLKTIYESTKQEEQQVSTKSVTEPFTILLLGVDGTGDGIANMSANGDSLLLVTFNPTTFKATILSIPRDSYVPISCLGGKKNKITHSAWGGEKCIIKTIENMTNLTIDYYAKINFNGIVELVDTLGGIDVDVEYSFCEQDSKRRFGENTVYVKQGYQTINGEQALAYSRNRHPNPLYCSKEWTNYDSNDFIRGTHQQEVLKAILTKIKGIRDLSTIYSLLDTISNNMETNMDINTILSFYNVGKDLAARFKESASIDDIINIEKLYLNGYSSMIYDYSQITNSGSKMVLYDYVPYKGSINDIVSAMKVNLGLEKESVIKEFSYDANSEYTKAIIGKKSYSEAGVELLPDFTGKSKEFVQTYANSNDLKLTIEYVTDENYPVNSVISQEPHSKMDLSEMSKTVGLKVTINQAGPKFDPTYCTKEEYKDNAKCVYVDYTGKSHDEFVKWISAFTNIKSHISYSPITESSADYDAKKAGLIESITISGNPTNVKSIYDIRNASISVKYYAKKTVVEQTPDDTIETNPNPDTGSESGNQSEPATGTDTSTGEDNQNNDTND